MFKLLFIKEEKVNEPAIVTGDQLQPNLGCSWSPVTLAGSVNFEGFVITSQTPAYSSLTKTAMASLENPDDAIAK